MRQSPYYLTWAGRPYKRRPFILISAIDIHVFRQQFIQHLFAHFRVDRIAVFGPGHLGRIMQGESVMGVWSVKTGAFWLEEVDEVWVAANCETRKKNW